MSIGGYHLQCYNVSTIRVYEVRSRHPLKHESEYFSPKYDYDYDYDYDYATPPRFIVWHLSRPGSGQAMHRVNVATSRCGKVRSIEYISHLPYAVTSLAQYGQAVSLSGVVAWPSNVTNRDASSTDWAHASVCCLLRPARWPHAATQANMFDICTETCTEYDSDD